VTFCVCWHQVFWLTWNILFVLFVIAVVQQLAGQTGLLRCLYVGEVIFTKTASKWCSWQFFGDRYFSCNSCTPCLKNVPPFTCYDLDVRDPITVIFGRSVTEKVRNQTMLCLPTSSIYCFSITLRKRKPRTQRTGALCVQWLRRSRLPFCWTKPPSTPTWMHWLQDLGSPAAAQVWVVSRMIEEIKQRLVEFRQCTNTAFEWKCDFRVSPFYQVVQKHTSLEVA